MTRRARHLLAALLVGGCAPAVPAPATPAPSVAVAGDSATHAVRAATQLVVVTTAGWDTTTGVLRRFERAAPRGAWRPVGGTVPVVVGRAGLAWDDAVREARGGPLKREGDGRAPAGWFPLDTVFGFAPAAEAAWVRLPYVALAPGSECVDDAASAHYNTVVDRAAVPRVDWASAEHMRAIEQYRLGVIVGYNAAPPRAGRGSCIFLHVWAGRDVATSGCTAMEEGALRELVLWMDRARRPMLVQLPDAEYARLRAAWELP